MARPRRLIAGPVVTAPVVPVAPAKPAEVVQFTAYNASINGDIVRFADAAGNEHKIRLTPDGLRSWRAMVRRG
jgi:hypothetical protein